LAPLVVCTACAADAPPVADDSLATEDTAESAYRYRSHPYVTSSVVVPTSASAADALGFDLDGDGAVDNVIGKDLAFVSQYFNVASYVQQVIQSGQIVILHSLHTAGMIRSTHAKWHLYLGNPQANPDLTSGHGQFTVDPLSPRDVVLAGSVAHRGFAGEADEIVLSFRLGATALPVTVHLIAVHFAAAITDTACTGGRVGAAIPVKDVNEQLLPAAAAIIDGWLANDGCTASASACTSTDRLLLSVLDTNGDRFISADELRSSSLLQSFLAPDVDVFDAAGNPGHDGVKDALSVAVGFTCTAAQFTE
jgi:hypothetical protein